MTVFKRNAVLLVYLGLSLAIAALDAWRGMHFSLWALYFIPIGLAAWNLGAKPGGALAVLAVAYALVVFFLGELRNKEVGRVYVPPRVGG